VSDSYSHHVPQFHIRLPRGFLNDPNGPVEFDGTTHLYFQSRSTTDIRMPVEWGHATSTDLVSWTLHRPAIVPVPGGVDSDGCWSGNAIVQGREIHAYYSAKTADSPYQPVVRAVSVDGGVSFGLPEPMIAEPEGVTMFRDPFIVRETDGYRLVVGAARTDGSAAVLRYVSSDGVTWQPAGDLARLARTEVDGEDTGEGWECPQLLPTGSGEWALVSAWSFADGIGHVLAFGVDEPARPRRVDHGQNFYASSVMRESSSGPVVWGWITEGRDISWWQADGWAGALSLPRVATPSAGRLASMPHPALDGLRTGSGRPLDGATIGAQAELVVDEAPSGVIRLQFSADEWCDVVVDREAGTVSVDRSHASSDARAHQGVAVAPDAFASSGLPDLRIFVDGSVVEVFTSAGRVLTTRVYPLAAPPWTVSAPSGLVWDVRRTVR